MQYHRGQVTCSDIGNCVENSLSTYCFADKSIQNGDLSGTK